MPVKHIAIACQGGGSHAAYAAGALPVLLPQFHNAELAAAPAGNRQSDEAVDMLSLSGISGTSGGAISALLAWYGFLLGGPDAARAGLERFWDANCANVPGERLLNDLTQWIGNLTQVDLKLSPYQSPLRDIGAFATGTWPMLAKLWPPLDGWIRGNYFQLREAIAPHVDFDLVGAIGDFCSIPLEVRRWHACALEARMAAPAAQERLRRTQAGIEDDIRARLAAADWITSWAREHALPPDCLLRAAFDGWQRQSANVHATFSADALDRIADRVRHTTRAIPQLLVGAVDAGITLDAVVASASLPWVFMAQSVQGTDPESHERRRMVCCDALWEQLAQQVGMMGARPSPRLEHALPWLPGHARIAGGLVASDVVAVEGARRRCAGMRATPRWTGVRYG